jgi:hypothetical protein
MLVDEPNLFSEAFSVFRGSRKAAVRHSFKDVQLGVDTGSPQRAMQNDRV